MGDGTSYSAGDAIYDLGRARTLVEQDPGLDDAVAIIDRVQSWLAHPSGRTTPDWAIPQMPVDEDPILGEHPPLHEGTFGPYSGARDARIVTIEADVRFANADDARSDAIALRNHLPVRHLECGCIKDGRPPEAWRADYDGLIFRRDDCIIHALKAAAVEERMADELEGHLAMGAENAVAEAERILEDGQ